MNNKEKFKEAIPEHLQEYKDESKSKKMINQNTYLSTLIIIIILISSCQRKNFIFNSEVELNSQGELIGVGRIQKKIKDTILIPQGFIVTLDDVTGNIIFLQD